MTTIIWTIWVLVFSSLTWYAGVEVGYAEYQAHIRYSNPTERQIAAYVRPRFWAISIGFLVWSIVGLAMLGRVQ